MNKSHLLINEPALQVLPSLAKVIGLNEAIVLQQLHYWLNNPKVGIEKHGEKWIFNTYEEWVENFPFWSVSTVKRIFTSLEEHGVVISAQLDAKQRDMTKFYRIDYDQLETLEQFNLNSSIGAKRADVNNESETTTENTNILKTDELQGSSLRDNSEDSWIGFEKLAHEAAQRGQAWRGRELLPPEFQIYGDWWHSKTGLHMYGAKSKAKVDAGWMKAFKELWEHDITLSALDEAWAANEWRKVSTPMQIVNDAKAIQAAPKVNSTTQNEEGKGFYA